MLRPEGSTEKACAFRPAFGPGAGLTPKGGRLARRRVGLTTDVVRGDAVKMEGDLGNIVTPVDPALMKAHVAVVEELIEGRVDQDSAARAADVGISAGWCAREPAVRDGGFRVEQVGCP